jgi:nucleotide-binding universal stress UspA family protein
MKQPDNAIVVAIGHHGFDASVEFAVAEAQRTHSPLHMVQVLQLPATAEYGLVYANVVKDTDAVIEEALAAARRLAGRDLPMTGERVEEGRVVGELVRRADRGRMIVLQHRRLGALRRLVTGSTTNGVAARAEVPVVSVPDDWSAGGVPSTVTVAVQDTVEAESLLRVAFEQARARGADLAVLHVWWLAGGYDGAIADQAISDDWDARARQDLAPVIATLTAEYADVPVVVHVRHDRPAEAILEAGRTSELLVLGRRHHLLPLGTHLGPVARATLQHSACPVLTVPSDRSTS